jgi:hypothetical protein
LGHLSYNQAAFQVLMAMSKKMVVFWPVVLYSLVQVYQYSRGPAASIIRVILMMEAASTRRQPLLSYNQIQLFYVSLSIQLIL